MDRIAGPRWTGTTDRTSPGGLRTVHLVRDPRRWTSSCGVTVTSAIEWPAARALSTLTCGTCRRSATSKGNAR